MPWTPAIIYTLGFAADSAAPLTAGQITPFVFYSFAMLVVMAVSIIFGVGRQDGMRALAQKEQEKGGALS